ncbi:N-6 DNA methylase [Priestia megaterium]|uniref:N-6 DNA methylase n=1 Tax=Priestia megaterium TaxID=1404 RepID=UPI0032E3C6DB
MQDKMIDHYILKYFSDLGYYNIRTNVHINGREVDAAVFDNQGKVVSIIEYTSSIKNILRDIKKIDGDGFHPLVSNVQTRALEVGANYFALTNGEEIIWFTTDEETGFPRATSGPDFTLSTKNKERKHSLKEDIMFFLEKVKEVVKDENLFFKTVLLKLWNEHYGHSINNIISNRGLGPLLDNGSIFDSSDEEINLMLAVSSWFDQVHFGDIYPQEFLETLDQVIAKNKRKHSIFIPRWLSDFMVKLSDIDNSAYIWDINALNGNIITAAHLNYKNLTTVEYTSNKVSTPLIEIENFVMGTVEKRIIRNQTFETAKPKIEEKPSHIISFSPVGKRNPKLDVQLDKRTKDTYSEDFFLKKTLELVKENGIVTLLIPDSLLYSSGKRLRTKQYILKNATIKAIISLPRMTFHPYSEVKMSLIILKKGINSKSVPVFMADLTDLVFKDTFHSMEIPLLSKVMENYKSWCKEGEIQENNSFWVTDLNQLNIENWIPFYYKSSELYTFDGFADFDVVYEKIPVKDLTSEILRGTPIKISPEGTIPVLGPAGIRPLHLEISKIQKTLEELLPNRIVQVEKGEIVINNIGSYVGAASYIEDNYYNPLLVNQHVIILKPLKDKILPEYFAIVLNSEYVKSQFKIRSTGTTMPAINLTNMKQILVPVPTIEIQKQLVEEVQKLKNIQEKLQLELDNVKKNLDMIVSKLKVREEE